jgi:hypothetical protein
VQFLLKGTSVTQAASSTDFFEVEPTLEAFYEWAEETGSGDGLPLVPPTEERVTEMLGPWASRRDESLGAVQPYGGEATYEKLAINCVMAGCRPSYFPVVCTAVQAAISPEFNLYGIQATTSPVTPMVVVNGPIAKELNINSGRSAFGPGWRANATIGRALRLILLNIGGGKPRSLENVNPSMPAFDSATQGSPAKFTFCAAEAEQDSPWEPLHVERGFDIEDSTVTVIGVDSIHAYRDTASQTGEDIATCMASVMGMFGTANMLYGQGSQPTIVLSPEHASILAKDNWSKSDLKNFLFEHARLNLLPLGKPNQDIHRRRRPKWFDLSDMPVCDSPSDIIAAVIGGPGIHSVFLGTFSGSQSVTRALIQAE